MPVQSKEYYLEKKEMTKVQAKLCILCGKYKEILMPELLTVNEKTWKLLWEVKQKNTYFKLNNSSYHNPHIDGTVDDITLKPIKGMGYQVNIETCLECQDKIGHRHQHKDKYINKNYASKFI
jgi:hypothetical protein